MRQIQYCTNQEWLHENLYAHLDSEDCISHCHANSGCDCPVGDKVRENIKLAEQKIPDALCVPAEGRRTSYYGWNGSMHFGMFYGDDLTEEEQEFLRGL